MLGGADNPNGELLSYIIGADRLPSLTQKPGFAATGTVAPPLSRCGLRSRHPGKKTPGCKEQRRFANRASRRCGGSRNSTDDGG